MLKIRVEGLPEEAAAFAEALERAGVVLERSRPYANRGASKYVRLYLDVEAPPATCAVGASLLDGGCEHA